MGQMRNAYRILLGNLKGRDHSEDLGVDGRIILRQILGKQSEKAWTGRRDQWRALMNTVMKFGFHKTREIS
jgi:hypothetical protein